MFYGLETRVVCACTIWKLHISQCVNPYPKEEEKYNEITYIFDAFILLPWHCSSRVLPAQKTNKIKKKGNLFFFLFCFLFIYVFGSRASWIARDCDVSYCLVHASWDSRAYPFKCDGSL